jgi:tetratricopeptide (TPR) repeat protein
VTGAGPSPAHAHVLAQVARFDMLSGRHEESLTVADRAIELAERVGAHGPRASALITRATANANGGSYARLREDFAEAHALAQEHEVSELSRAQINLSSILLDLGELSDALGVARDGLAYAERTGTAGGSAGFVRGNLSEALFLSGAWEEAEAIARAELERASRTGGLYYEPWFRFVLAELALVRDGRREEAADSAREQVEQARTRGDDQSFLPVVGGSAWTLTRVGAEEEAHALLDELLERRRANPHGVMPGYWFVFIALALVVLGRSGALAELEEPPGSAWLEAARAIDGGRLDAAADVLRRVGAPQLEAETLVLSSRARREAGDADGAASRLARARELLGALGATARLREVGVAPRQG